MSKWLSVFFCASEFQCIRQLSPPKNYLAFYLAWTSKEAYLKATGQGLSGGLDSLETELNIEKNQAKIISIKGEENMVNNWQLYNFEIIGDFIVSVVVETKERQNFDTFKFS